MPRRSSRRLSRISANDVDLTIGINNLIKGIQHQNPEISVREVETLGNALLGQAGKALRNGERLSSVRFKPDGNFDLRIWHINPKEEE